MTDAGEQGRFQRLVKGLAKTRAGLFSRLRQITGAGTRLDEEKLEEIEEILVGADCGMGVATAVLEALRQRAASGNGSQDPLDWVRHELLGSFPQLEPAATGTPHVVLMVGVNGSGKTTTAGKLAARARENGQKVVLAAADTYRAAAAEQLEQWGDRTDAHVVRQKEGSDPAAVVVDALRAARARAADLVLVDTAGRLHTRVPLMRELEKIGRVCGKEIPGAPHEVLLVLDAGTGQNGLIQAQHFTAALPLTGLILTKLDGTAKGGVALALSRELQLPIRYVGVGEATSDLLDFSPGEFIEGLLAADGTP